MGCHHGRRGLGPHPLGLWDTGWNLAFSYPAQGCGSWVLTHQLLPARREGPGQPSTENRRCRQVFGRQAWRRMEAIGVTGKKQGVRAACIAHVPCVLLAESRVSHSEIALLGWASKAKSNVTTKFLVQQLIHELA